MKQSRALRASLALAGVAFVCGMAGNSYAHSGTKEDQDACTPDVFRFCSAQIPDEARIVACLNRNLKKLSANCRVVMTGGQLTRKARPQ